MRCSRIRRIEISTIPAWLLAAVPAGAQQIIDLPAEDRWLEAGIEEVYRVGAAVTGQDWQQFGEIAEVAFDAAGNLYVFDRQAQRIFVVGPDGHLIRELGRPGEGPGEFSTSGAMAVFADGRLVVVAQPGADAIIGVPTLATGMTMGKEAFRQPVRLDTSHAFERATLSGEESETDTVAEAWLPPIDTEGLDRKDLRNYAALPTRLLPEFSPELHWGVLPDGRVVFSDSSTYTVKVAEAGTGVVRILTRPFPTEPVTGRVIRAEKDRRLRQLEETTAPGANLRERRREIEELEFHTELSVIRGLGTTWDGKIWVLRRGEGPRDDGPIDVLDADGRYLGSYRAGATRIPDAFGPDGLGAYVERNELGVQTVVVRRIVVGHLVPPSTTL